MRNTWDGTGALRLQARTVCEVGAEGVRVFCALVKTVREMSFQVGDDGAQP